jgi:hypothetical protein
MCLTGGSTGAAKIPFNPKPKFGSPIVRRETSLKLACMYFPAVPFSHELNCVWRSQADLGQSSSRVISLHGHAGRLTDGPNRFGAVPDRRERVETPSTLLDVLACDKGLPPVYRAFQHGTGSPSRSVRFLTSECWDALL